MLTIVISGIEIMGTYVLFICKKQLLHEKKKRGKKGWRKKKNGQWIELRRWMGKLYGSKWGSWGSTWQRGLVRRETWGCLSKAESVQYLVSRESEQRASISRGEQVHVHQHHSPAEALHPHTAWAEPSRFDMRAMCTDHRQGSPLEEASRAFNLD